MGADFVILSLTPIVIGTLASIACALLGNFLVLRRQSLVGDAVSHVALPGIVVAVLVTGTISTWPMMLGAAGAAVVAAILIEVVRRVGRVEPGAAMGVVFTTLFAFGVLLLERSDASAIHLDVEHALYGNLESLVWLSADGWASLLDPAALAGLPEQLPRLALVLVVIVLVLAAFFKELVLSTFDAEFARSVGARPDLFGFLLIIMVALAAVAAFDAVGSIIVIAMFICPAAAARLMTDRLMPQLWWSVLFATIAAVLGYVLAGYGPGWFGHDTSVSAAGMIAGVAGAILLGAALWGPRRRGIKLSAQAG